MSSRSSRSSPSISDLLEEQFRETRKRRRSKEEEEEEEEEEERERSREDEEEEEKEKDQSIMNALPPEIQLMLIEQLEKANRNVKITPSSKLNEVSRIWRLLYYSWKSSKGKKLEHEFPIFDEISLAMTRLFISPRFKLISSMQWPAVHEILSLSLNFINEKNKKKKRKEIPSNAEFQILCFYKNRKEIMEMLD